MKLERLACDIVPQGQKLRPLRDQIVVKVLEFNWSDILVETYRGSPVRGEVVATGPGRYPYLHKRGDKDGKRFHEIRESQHFRPTEVKIGDVVELGGLENNGYSFQRVIMDGAEHLVISEQDIAVVHGQ